jgi:Ca-activated chloride channel homolog
MNATSSPFPNLLIRRVGFAICLVFVTAIAIGSWRNPNFWSTPDQRGDALFRQGKYQEAAKTYVDPIRIGTAQYRNGDFKEAAQTFARVPGAIGAFNQANALLMHGAYDPAIASYDRALVFRPDWKEAEENKALAIVRRDKIKNAGENSAQAPEDNGEAIVFDLKGDNKKTETVDLAQSDAATDEALRATWLRRVQTTPGDFLRAKFAYQAQVSEPPQPQETPK